MTTVRRIAWPAYNEHRNVIRAAVWASRNATPHSQLGVGGSWAGPKTLFEDRRTHQLRDWIKSNLTEDIEHIDAWGTMMQAGDKFQHPTTRVNEMWQTDFTYFRAEGWGWYYFSIIICDFSRSIVHNELCPSMQKARCREKCEHGASKNRTYQRTTIEDSLR